MCGIAGWFGREPRVPAPLNTVVQRLSHRGPDGSGVYLNPGIALYHSRLSIIDLSGGAQPLITADGRFALVANGEIYNYLELRKELEKEGARFKTHSDCEVILQGYALWGSDVLKRLEGMYAFALHDVMANEVLLARDPLGMKPLFLSRQPFGCAFASEIKALLPMLPARPQVEPVALVQYLECQHSLGKRTVFQGIERVGAGEALLLREGVEVKRWRHWDVISIAAETPEHPVEALDELMATVFTQHLRSDVPIGLFLSGGVDSTILLGLMRRYGIEDITTFSLGFPGSSVGDELAAATKLATHFRTRHQVITPDADSLLQRFVHTIWAADELMRDWANLPTSLLAAEASASMKVVFSGEGGDEAFAGYGRYRAGWLERSLKRLMYPDTDGFRSRGDLRGNLASVLLGDTLSAARADWREPLRSSWQRYPEHWSDLQRMQALDLEHALPDNLLVKADRMLMAQGMEGRMPFVDRRVVAFGLALADDWKCDKRQGKKILKRWAQTFMPAEHFTAAKRGFYVPIRDWWQGERLERLGRSLRGNEAINQWFRPEGVEALLAQQEKRGKSARYLMTLLQFAIWHRLFIEGDGAAPGEQVDPLTFLDTGG
jgi:asparagine synthase (glutamine-hydrolysing)